jgi:hypothetical protein
MDWDEDLMEPTRATIDAAFHAIIDGSCETFKAEAAQAGKEVMDELDRTLKSESLGSFHSVDILTLC